METLERIVMAHPVFAGLEAALGPLIAGCARNLRFDAGAYLVREGAPADEFYLLRHGAVAIESRAPGGRIAVLGTEREGDIVGITWLLPPYRWRFDARALELTRAIGIDATCLRGKCEADPALGYAVMKRFMPLVARRLDEARLQLADVYATEPGR